MEKAIREIAHKVWISDLSETSFKNGGLIVGDKIVSRVNLVGNVVGRYDKEKSYISLLIDDGSAGIRLKAWGDDAKICDGLGLGDVALVVGKIRQSNVGEIFVAPEIVKKVGVQWELTRKLELIKEHGLIRNKPVEEKKEGYAYDEGEDINKVKIETVRVGSVRQILMSILKNDGKTFDQLKKEAGYSEDEVDSVLQELINEGEIYEVRGVYRLLG